MARWKLLNDHYLNIVGNTWEYKEVDRSTGRQVRKEFEVPQLLSVGDPSDHNSKDANGEGEIVVSNRPSDYTRDYIFRGDPTPDMLPLDDEAKEISASFAGRWKHPIENLTTSYSQSLIDGFHTEMEKIQTKVATEPSADVSALTKAVTQMAEMQAAMMQALTNKPVTDARRV